jgi:hypothetical protein
VLGLNDEIVEAVKVLVARILWLKSYRNDWQSADH